MRRVNTEIKQGADSLTIEAISTLYNYRAVAAVRENVSNGIDAHTEADVTRPLDVTCMFSTGSLRVVVADTGIGMTAHEIENDYLSIEVSRKRNNDALIGGHGVGVLSTFAATSAMTVISTKNGETTTAHGVNHGHGNIEWTIDTLGEPLPNAGTTVDFTMDVTSAESAAVAQYLVMLAYLHNIRLTLTAADKDYNPLRSWCGELANLSSAMVEEHTDTRSVIRPFRVRDYPELNNCAYDTDFLLGHKAGLISCPITIGSPHLPVDFVMPVVGGLPYRLGVNPDIKEESASVLAKHNMIFMATEKWIDNSALADLTISSIPRNREYIEVDPTSYDPREVVKSVKSTLFFNEVQARRDIVDIFESNMDYIIANSPVLDRERDFQPLISYLLERTLAAQVGGTVSMTQSLWRQADAFGDCPALRQALAVMTATPTPNVYTQRARSVIDALYTHLRDNAPHAIVGSANTQLDDRVSALCSASIARTKTLTIGHVVEAMYVLAAENRRKAKYKNKVGTVDKGEADKDFKNSLVSVVCEDLPQDITLWDKQTRTDVATHSGRTAQLVTAFAPPSVTESVKVRLFNYLVSTHATTADRTLFSGEDDTFVNPMSPGHFNSFTVTGLGFIPGEIYHLPANIKQTTWRVFTTPLESEKKARTWAFKHIVLNEDGSYVVADDAAITTAQGRELAQRPDTLLAPLSNHASILKKEKKDSVRITYDNTPGSRDSKNRAAEIAALYAAGYRDVFVYNDKSSSVLAKIARTHWIDPWCEHALPALNELNDMTQVTKTKHHLACTAFVRPKRCGVVIPSYGDLSRYIEDKVEHLLITAGWEYDMARKTRYMVECLLNVRSPLYYELATRAVEEHPDIPREFVLNHYIPGAEKKGVYSLALISDPFHKALESYTESTREILIEQRNIATTSPFENEDLSGFTTTVGASYLQEIYELIATFTDYGRYCYHYVDTADVEDVTWIAPEAREYEQYGWCTDSDMHDKIVDTLSPLFSQMVRVAWDRYTATVDFAHHVRQDTDLDSAGIAPLVRDVYKAAGAVEFVPTAN